MAGTRQPARGRFDTSYTAEMRRQPHASGGIAAQTEGRTARGDQRRLAAARTAGRLGEVVGIVGPPAKEVVGLEGEQQIGQVRSRNRDPARRAQPGDQCRVANGFRRPLKTFRTGGTHRARHLDGIFHREGHSIDGAQRGAGPVPSIRGPRFHTRAFREDFDRRVQQRVHILDALQMSLYQFRRRNARLRESDGLARCRKEPGYRSLFLDHEVLVGRDIRKFLLAAAGPLDLDRSRGRVLA